MSTKGGPVFTFSLPGGAARLLAPPSVTPLISGPLLSNKFTTLAQTFSYATDDSYVK